MIPKLTDYHPFFNHNKKEIILLNGQLSLVNTIENSMDSITLEKSTLYKFFDNFSNLYLKGYNFLIVNNTEGHILSKVSSRNKNKIYSFDDLFEIFPIKVLTGNLIKKEHRISCLTWMSLEIVKSLDTINSFSTNFDKKFLFLNRIPKIHRVMMYEEMKKNNLLSSCYYSFNPQKYTTYLGFSKEHETKSVENEYTFIDDGKLEYWESDKFNIDYYHNNSFCNIITESEYESDIIFFTEKLTKTILSQQPFLVLSSAGYLKKLKELGFKTFNNWWDETYDDVIDLNERIHKLIKTIKYINNLKNEEICNNKIQMKNVLKHNKELLFKIEKKYPHYFLYKDYGNIKNTFI